MSVSNNSPYRVYCKGYLYARDQYGNRAKEWFSGYVPSYGYMNGQLYAKGSSRIVKGWAKIRCRY